MQTVISQDWQQVFDKLPPLCSRQRIADATGIISSRTLANLDCMGKGIEGKRIVAKRAVYPKEAVIKFILEYVGE